MRTIGFCLAVAAIHLSAAAAHGADAEAGKRIAQVRCAPCHVVVPNQRDELANSPAFEIIARKFGFNADRLAAAARDPHPRMNMTLTQSEANDIALYISGLGR